MRSVFVTAQFIGRILIYALCHRAMTGWPDKNTIVGMDDNNKPPLKQPEPIYIRLEKNGRAGKTVTVLEGFRMHPEGKEELLARFKRRCGAGGTMKEGRLEIQGDQRQILLRELDMLGYRVKGQI